MSKKYEGSCFCGAVRIEVEGDAIMQGFCHCSDCRSWSATPVTAYSLWPADSVRVTAGSDLVTRFDKHGKSIRCSCGTCGGGIMTELPSAGWVDVYPSVLSGVPFSPSGHVFYGERVMDLPDGLPKFRDLPEGAGGSGEMIDD